MGTFVFQWSKPASEVFVTGSFDNWAKEERLEKNGDVFSKQVVLPSASDEYYFKYYVDGAWQLDTSYPTANDAMGNTNNILRPSSITPLSEAHTSTEAPLATGAALISGVAPGSTTAGLAGQVPLEKDKAASGAEQQEEMPGGFPEEFTTPLQEPADLNMHPVPDQTFGVSPLPATGSLGNPIRVKAGDPLPPASSYTNNTISSNVKTDQASYEASAGHPAFAGGDQPIGISPLPATSGFGNPVQVKPGEPLPHPSSYTRNTIESHVKTDPASYENSSSHLSGTATQSLDTSGGAFGVPPISHNMIPESSLPMGTAAGASTSVDAGPMISSTAGLNTTTAALAGQVPLEPRGVPQVVQDSQEVSGAPKEAAASSVAVAQKDRMEQELTQKVPEQPPASEDYPTSKLTTAAVGTAAAAGAAVIGGVATVAGLVSEKGQKAVSDIQAGKNPVTGSGGIPAPDQVAATVPGQAAESFEKAHESPEAAANPAAVANKTAMENELEQKVPTTDATSAPGPSQSYTSALSSTAPSAKATGVGPDGSVIADSDTMPAVLLANETTPGTSTAPVAVAGGAAVGTAAAIGAVSQHNSAFATDPVRAPGHVSASETTKPIHANIEAFKDDPISATYSSQANAAASNISSMATGAGAAIAGVAAGSAAALGLSSAETSSDKTKPGEVSPSDQFANDSMNSTYQSQNAATTNKATSSDASAADATSSKAKQAGAAVAGTAAAGAAAVGLPASDGRDGQATDTSGLNAPASKPAQTIATETGQLSATGAPAGAVAPSAAAHSAPAASTAGAGASSMATAMRGREESRDVSPMSKGPMATSGVDSTKTAPVSGWKEGNEPTPKSTPQKIKDTAASAASPSSTTTSASKEEKKKNRRSFFGKIKEKLKH